MTRWDPIVTSRSKSVDNLDIRRRNTMTVRKVLTLFAVLALAIAACGGGDDGGDSSTETTAPGNEAGRVVEGATVYSGTCTACHGVNLEGIEGLGKPLAPSEFVASQTEAELAAFVKVGRPTSDPANTQGVDMPPKGGNPSLNDQDLLDVSAYIQSLN
jgi:mono/diheme cytochrome c family protein